MKNIYFGKNLKFLREKKGLKQSEMIDFIGIKQTTWNGYENEKSFPKFEDLIKISKIFDVSETELIHTNLESSSINQTEDKSSSFQLNENQESYNTNYKDLADSRKETIDCLRKEIVYLEEKIASLIDKRKAG